MSRRSNLKAQSRFVNQSFNSSYPATDSKRQARLRIAFKFHWPAIGKMVSRWLQVALFLTLSPVLLQHATPQITPTEEPFLCTVGFAQKPSERRYFEYEFKTEGRVTW